MRILNLSFYFNLSYMALNYKTKIRPHSQFECNFEIDCHQMVTLQTGYLYLVCNKADLDR